MTEQLGPRPKIDERTPTECVPFYMLTVRERQVLQHISDGLTCDEMASEIGISKKTVAVHRHKIGAIGIRGRSAGVGYSRRNEYPHQQRIMILGLIQDGVSHGYIKHKLPESSIKLLTKSEDRVLDNILNGRSSKETADEFFVSTSTVEAHMANIHRKLGTRSVYQTAARVACLRMHNVAFTIESVNKQSWDQEMNARIKDVASECVPFYMLSREEREFLQRIANGDPDVVSASLMHTPSKKVSAFKKGIGNIGLGKGSDKADGVHRVIVALLQDGVINGYLKHGNTGEAVKALTEREAEVIALLESGMTCGELVKTIYISPKTLDLHMRHIRLKLGTKNLYHTVARVTYLKAHGLWLEPVDRRKRQ